MCFVGFVCVGCVVVRWVSCVDICVLGCVCNVGMVCVGYVC